MLTEGMQLKKVAFLDTVFEGTKADDGGFDTDVAIATGELVKLIPDLIEALGGEAESGVASAAEAIAAGGPAAAPQRAPAVSAPASPPTAARATAPAMLPPRKSGAGVVTGPATAPVDTDPESAPF